MSKATRRRRSDPSRVGPPRNARLRRIAITAAAAAVVTACGAEGEDSGREAIPAPTNAPSPQVQKMASPVPDLAVCPARTLLEEGLRERTEPIAVPAALRSVMRSGMDNFAFVTLAGATVCVDASWMEAIEKPALSPDGRFASFDWGGYEAFGHVIVDRVGKGSAGYGRGASRIAIRQAVRSGRPRRSRIRRAQCVRRVGDRSFGGARIGQPRGGAAGLRLADRRLARREVHRSERGFVGHVVDKFEGRASTPARAANGGRGARSCVRCGGSPIRPDRWSGAAVSAQGIAGGVR